MYILFWILAAIICLVAGKFQSSALLIVALFFLALGSKSYKKRQSIKKEQAINEQIRENKASYEPEADAVENSASTVSRDCLIERLQPYDEVKKCTCPKCGYTGLVGVDRKKRRSRRGQGMGIGLLVALPILFLIYKLPIDFLLQMVFFFVAIPVCIIISFILELYLSKTSMYCPSCTKKFK